MSSPQTTCMLPRYWLMCARVVTMCVTLGFACRMTLLSRRRVVPIAAPVCRHVVSTAAGVPWRPPSPRRYAQACAAAPATGDNASLRLIVATIALVLSSLLSSIRRPRRQRDRQRTRARRASEASAVRPGVCASRLCLNAVDERARSVVASVCGACCGLSACAI